jgi:hypothetical protein
METLEVDPTASKRYKRNARIRWDVVAELKSIDERTPIDYFWHFFPMEAMKECVEATNAVLDGYGNYKPVDMGELYEWLGIRLYMCIEPRKGDVDEFWKDGRKDGSVYLGGSLKSLTQMSQHRWKLIRMCLKFHTSDGRVRIEEVCMISIVCLIVGLYIIFYSDIIIDIM